MAAPTATEILSLLALFLLLGGLVYGLQVVRWSAMPSTDIPELDTEFVQRETPAMRARRRRRGGLSRAHRAVQLSSDEDDSSSAAEVTARRSKKKDANREAKREAQQAHLARLEAMRERRALDDDRRIQDDAREAQHIREKHEQQRRLDEDKEKKEMEEYDNWKHLISVEDSGDGAELEMEEDNLLQRFCEYVRTQKIVKLEELGGEFGMRTQDVVDRLTRLEESGELTGFFDDRGKFVYVSKGEMEDVAGYIKKKGRVGIQELSAESSRLLHLDTAGA